MSKFPQERIQLLRNVIRDNVQVQNETMTDALDEIDKLNDLIKRLVEDGERLASTYVIEVFPHEWVCRGGCHHWARFGEQIEHSPDCPITLHRALMKELE